jgi:acetylornithine deacetylase/succinyl-diaminopimelate desuccinylase-like protein
MSLPDGMAELLPWLRIPSISGDRRYADKLSAAANWLARWLAAAGAEVSELPTAMAPVVLGRFRGSRLAPLSMVYGHYDVQPPGPGWSTAPFEPSIRAGRLYARGASDDKGQLFVHLLALRELTRRGLLRGDVVVVAEGAEEIGSPGLRAALTRLPLRPAAIVISDTQRLAEDTPAITVSQRGLVKLALRVDVGGHPVHPGRYAGAVLDPALELAAILLRLREAVAGLPGCAPAAPANRLVQVSDRRLLQSSGGRVPSGAPGRHARLSTHGAVAVSRLRAGGPGAAVPSAASATVDVRLPPGVDPVAAGRLLASIARAGPGSRLTVTVLGLARGTNRLPAQGILDAVDAASVAGFGHRPAYVRSGGSVPAVWELARRFGVTPLLWGLGPPGDGAHGPDEYFDVQGWSNAVSSGIRLWQSVTDVSKAAVADSADRRRRGNRPAPCLRG